MKNFLITACALFLSQFVFAQFVIVVDAIPSNTPEGASIYLASSINSWNPGDEAFVFTEVDGNYHLALPESTPSSFEGKLTRGDWPSAEGSQGGGYIPNRNFDFSNADTLHITVLSWEDLGGVPTDLPPNVVTISSDFYMPELDRNRRVRLFLPSDYDDSTNDYPVLYMHDGQNLFSAQEAFAGEWEVDEAMLNFEANGYGGAIIVAIDNGGSHRIDEYTPWANVQYGGGEGAEYMEFIVNTLKPYVDDNYRTLSDRENTGIMGSSLGGLISHYGGMKYQNVFSKVGVFSPSFWFTDDIYAFTSDQGHQEDMKFYFLAGGNESGSLEADVEAMMDSMMANGFNENELEYQFVANGQHSEWFWAQEFPGAFEWLFISESTNLDKHAGELNVHIYPNPVTDTLKLTLPENVSEVNVKLFDNLGKKVFQAERVKGELDLSDLSAGPYVLKISSEGRIQTIHIQKL